MKLTVQQLNNVPFRNLRVFANCNLDITHVRDDLYEINSNAQFCVRERYYQMSQFNEIEITPQSENSSDEVLTNKHQVRLSNVTGFTIKGNSKVNVLIR